MSKHLVHLEYRWIKKPSITISGPFFEWSSPYGKPHVSLDRDVWYVSRIVGKREKEVSEISKITGTTCLGSIVRYRQSMDSYSIRQLFPYKRFKTLNGAISFLVKNEGKLVFCT